MTIKRIEESRNVPIKIWTDEIEDSVLRQLQKTASLKFLLKHVAAMPDVHLGYDSTVTSVVATKGAIVPKLSLQYGYQRRYGLAARSGPNRTGAPSAHLRERLSNAEPIRDLFKSI
ncbi:MAG: RtcB family protein [Oligoflexus sp.]|nr:RtcB family protein [Oligoflexus sp.]